MDRFLCPGERETTMLGDSPTHKEPQAHRGRHSPRHLQPRPGREKEGPSLQPWGPGERRDPPCGPGALEREGGTRPRALGLQDQPSPSPQEAGVPPHISRSDFCPPDKKQYILVLHFLVCGNVSSWPGNLVLMLIRLRLAGLLWVFPCDVSASS